MMIEPFVSIETLQFGKNTADECIALYGDPNNIRDSREGVQEYDYSTFILRFDPTSHTLCECTLLPGAEARIGSLDVTWERECLRKACEYDGNVVDAFGFIVVPSLGIAVTGIHDDDPSQVGITVFPRCDLDEWTSEGSSFDVLTLRQPPAAGGG